jgi:hypothetical protein
MNDDAIAPVVAVMMILVVTVTLLSIWNAIYLPDLKQQAEMEHLKEVENSFVDIDESIRKMIIFQSNGELTESIPLGGGDIMLHQAKSGGVLSIREYDKPIVTIKNGGLTYNASMIKNISYTPSSNFWLNQGYEWKDGVINVTKGRISVPRFYVDVDEARNKGEVGWFNTVKIQNSGEEGIGFVLFNITVADPLSISGNGIAHVKMDGELSEKIELSGSPDSPVNLTIDTSTGLGEKNNETVSKLLEDNYWDTTPGKYQITETVNLTLYNLTISVR